MPDFTAEQVVAKLKAGEKLDRADLRGLQLGKQQLTGASFRRCDLEGANLEGAVLQKAILKNASLKEAYLAGADLTGADLSSADLEGANLEKANLAGANLGRANLEGANLSGANLAGAKMGHVVLDSANLGGANLEGADVSHSDLVECYLGGAKGKKCDLTSCNLEDANLEEADFTEATFEDAQCSRMGAVASTLVRARFIKADLSLTNLLRANLTGADLKRANIEGAKLDGATLTGVKIAGIQAQGAHPDKAIIEWVDVSTNDIEKRAPAAEAMAILSGRPPPSRAGGRDPSRRYFGRGDVLKFAALEFDSGVSVEIDSRFEQCTIQLGDGTELIVGPEGVLSGCQVTGGGNITINGTFFEGKTPGIVAPRSLVVSRSGALVGAVEQAAEHTQFAFEPGCKLRMKIMNAKNNGRP